MMELVGRKAEMETLRAFMDDPYVSGCAVYGVRQMGKTTLLRHLAKEYRSVYIQASMGSEESAVGLAMRYIREDFPTAAEPTTLAGLLDVLRDICSESPTLVIIDEYPYLSSSLAHADSAFQGFIDGTVADTGSKMIICGSQLSSMMRILNDGSNPLYSRFRMSLEVGPMTFEDTCLFHRGMGDIDLIRMYLVFGGIPTLHLMFRVGSFGEVVARMLSQGMPYGDMARGRIASEAGNPDSAEAVVRAIAAGHSSLGEISRLTGIPQSTCSKILSRLEDSRIVGRRVPMAGAPKKPRFIIADGFVGLWYTVFDGLDRFRLPDDAEARTGMLEGPVSTFLGRRFEMFCAEYMSRHYRCDAIGSWWGVEDDGEGGRVGVDIDLVADVREGGRRGTVFAECRFRRRMMKLSDLETLERRARAVDPNACLMLFSAGGFERQLAATAWMHGAVMVGPEELMGRAPAPDALTPRPPPASGAGPSDSDGDGARDGDRPLDDDPSGSVLPLREQLRDALLGHRPAGDPADEHRDLHGLQDLLLCGAVVLGDPGLGVDAVLAHPDAHAGQGHQPLGLPVQGAVLHHHPVHGVQGVDEGRVQLVDRFEGVRGESAHVRAHPPEPVHAASSPVPGALFLSHALRTFGRGDNGCPRDRPG